MAMSSRRIAESDTDSESSDTQPLSEVDSILSESDSDSSATETEDLNQSIAYHRGQGRAKYKTLIETQ